MDETTQDEPVAKKKLTNAELQKQVGAITGQVNDVTDAVNSLAEQNEDLGAKLDQMMEVFTRTLNKSVEPMEQDLGTERAPFNVGIDAQGDAVGIDKGVYDVDSPEFNDKMKLLEFMEEPVKVLVHQSSEKDADSVFDVSVNGRSQIFVRGQEYIVRRKYIEGLARAKPVHYENEEYTEIQSGSQVRSVRHPGRRGLRYPFTVLEDQNPQGAAWLKGVLAEE